MASNATVPPHVALAQPPLDTEWGVVRENIKLNKGRVSDVLRVFNGPCVILGMFLEITEAVANTACNLSWVLRSDVGGYRVIGDTVNIQAAALGDFFWAELDGTNIIKATTSTGLVYRGYNRFWYTLATADTIGGFGVIVPKGGIDFVLSVNNLASGKGSLYVVYKPLVAGACIVAEDMQSSTTSTTSTTSSSSSTASTTSTASSTSTSTSTSTSSSTSTSTSTSSSTSTTTSTSTSTSTTTSTTTTAAP